MLVGTAVPTMIARTKVSLAAVPTTLVGTAVTTIIVGTSVPTIIAGTKVSFTADPTALVGKAVTIIMVGTKKISLDWEGAPFWKTQVLFSCGCDKPGLVYSRRTSKHGG